MLALARLRTFWAGSHMAYIANAALEDLPTLLVAADAATGEGARLYGGCWNSRGMRVVYDVNLGGLAAVETFVNWS